MVKRLLLMVIALLPAGLVSQPAQAEDDPAAARRLESVTAARLAESQAQALSTYFVDPRQGNDAGAGSESSPWRTINHALSQMAPGDTLRLAPGRYHEQVTISLRGGAYAPISIIGSEEGETIIDGGLPEFFESPQAAWEPLGDELYRSTGTYRNIPGVAGSFADRNDPLLTYYLRSDLLAANQIVRYDEKTKLVDVDLYCGPGLWLDRDSGRIYARFSHTRNNSPYVADYTGETDPRKIPLVIAPIDSTPLKLINASHVDISNVTVTGGGHDTIYIKDCQYVRFNRINVRCGSFRGESSSHVKVLSSSFRGWVAPWTWRGDGSLGCASGNLRDIFEVISGELFDASHQTRSNPRPRVINDGMAHGGVFGWSRGDLDGPENKTPLMVNPDVNRQWEIAHSEFRGNHDGVYLTGRDMHMHHCSIDDMQDDAVDFSTPVKGLVDNVRFESNLIRRCVTAISTHNQGEPDGNVYFYRNVIDLRRPMAWMRPTAEQAEGKPHPGNGFFMHGSDAAKAIESYYLYHNTVVGHVFSRYFFGHGFNATLKAGATRRNFNNLFVYLDEYPMPFVSRAYEGMDLQFGHNLHWSIVQSEKNDRIARTFFSAWSAHEFSDAVAALPEGKRWASGSVMADPQFKAFDPAITAVNDYRPQPGSPAVGMAMTLPSTWPGASPHDQAVGALPPDGEQLRVGVDGRIAAGEPLR